MIIVGRKQWGAAEPLEPLARWTLNQPTAYAIHWEGSGGHTDHSLCALEVKAIQRYHQSHGYDDIAYNWLICLHGVIYEGRPAQHFQSAAQNNGNRTHIAVCFMWGPQWDLTPQAEAALVSLVRMRPLPAQGHGEIPTNSTVCPGPEINAFVDKLPVLVTRPARQGSPGGRPVRKPLPPAGVKHPTLKRGSKGPAVLELQRKLNTGFGQGLVLDGDFGPATENAVKNAQRWGKLEVDGIAGPKTWALVDYIAAVNGKR